MTLDRREHDPFAPHPPAPRAVPDDTPPCQPGPAQPTPEADHLDGLRKAQLVQLAEERGIDSDGTRADLIERLRAG